MRLSLLVALAVLLTPIGVFAQSKVNPTNTELIEALEGLYGPDMPHMYAIFTCESNLMQWKADGSVVRSPTKDTGIAQLNDIWKGKAAELNLDIVNSWRDNITMSKYIWKVQGFGAWTCSKVMEPALATI